MIFGFIIGVAIGLVAGILIGRKNRVSADRLNALLKEQISKIQKKS